MKKMLLILILLLASVLRLWQLGQVPGSIDWDEASLGYNAYSIMITGRDEYGKFLPVVLESFGDYKPALYTYLIIPFIPFFGLTSLAVRMPAAIIGVLAVLLTYFLAKELVKRSDIALAAAFFLAVSPWHIQFTRVAFEAGVGVFLNLAGVLFFLKSFKKNIFLLLSAIFFALSLYSYQSEKLFVPLMLILLAAVYWKNIFSVSKRYLFAAILIFIFVSLPIISFTLTDQNGLARAKGVSIFSQNGSMMQRNLVLYEHALKNNDIAGRVLHNNRVVYVKEIVAGYLSHFDLNWLFVTGDSVNRHHAPGVGLMYFIDLPVLLLGFYFLVFNNLGIGKKTKIFLLAWVLITPIPASFTTDVPHAVRTLNFLPSLQIIMAIGVVGGWLVMSKVKFRLLNVKAPIIAGVILVAFFVFNFMYYLNQYFVQQNYFYAKDWIYGFEQVVSFVKPIGSKYKKIVVSNKGYMDESYIFFLFYEKYDPKRYLAEGGSRFSPDGSGVRKFANYEFRAFEYANEKDLPAIFIGGVEDFENDYGSMKTIDLPDGTPIMKVIEKK